MTDKKELAEQLHILYKQWCKETKRGGGVLIGPSIKEFFKWLSPTIIEAMGEKPESEKDKSVIEAARHHAQVQWGDPAKFISQNEADCYKYAVSDFIEGALWASNRVEAMSINSENVYTKNPCDENVNMSGTRNDAQRYTAD